ncbi:MAG: penicillin acylase family protein [Chthonomonadales bacterium]
MKRSILVALGMSVSLISWRTGNCQTVTIQRDKFGTPTISAKTLVDAAYGQGYAAAMDNAVHMARNYKMARGRTAEIDGQSALIIDQVVRSLGMENYAIETAPKLTGEVAKFIDNYVAGANAALAKQKANLPTWVEPFTRVDVLTFGQFINAGMALQELQGELTPSMGSNQFALSPKRTTTGHALLSADPHLPWDGFFRWHEYGIETPELGFHGVTFPGLPFPAMGHTRNVAWCMTNNNPRQFTIYKVTPKPGDPTQYNYHGTWKTYTTETYEFKYIVGGEVKSRKSSVKMTEWGPMLPFQSRCVRLAMLGSGTSLEQTLNMLRAKDGAQFRKALFPRGISMFNIVYADTKGNIGYQYNARIPHRNSAINWRKTVDGADPTTTWGDLWSLDDLPRSVNPASGILVNCNSDPMDTWLGFEKVRKEYPADVTTYKPTTRFDLLSNLLLKTPKMSVEKAKITATETFIPYAVKAKDALVAAAAKANSVDPEALKILASWDGRANIDSVGASLYVYWLLTDPKMEIMARTCAESGCTPDMTSDAVEHLVTAVSAIKKDHGKLAVPWGDMHYTEHGGKRVPTAGFGYIARYDFASINPAAGQFKNGAIHCSVGSSYRMIVDLDPKGIKSWTVIPYGDSSNEKSPHFSDQMEMYGQRKYKPTLFGASALKGVPAEKLTIGK